VDPDLIGAFAHVPHWFEVNRNQPVLHPEKLSAQRLADLRWKLPQIVPAAANEQNGLRFHSSNYINIYLTPTAVCKSQFMQMPEMQP
jgi:hypothetical protein